MGKRWAVALIGLVLALSGCGDDGSDDSDQTIEPAAATVAPTEQEVIEVCRQGRIDGMAPDADPADLGADWPKGFTYSELVPGQIDGYYASWVEGQGMAIMYKCTFDWTADGALNVKVEQA